jgi:VanZ family protein
MKRRFTWKMALAAAWALAIPALSLLPPRFFHKLFRSSSPTVPGTDKVVHAVIYAVLTALLLWAFSPEDRRLNLRLAWNAVVLSILYGLLMETLQGLTQAALQRSADPLDGLANAAGAIAVALLWMLCRPRRKRADAAQVGGERQVE